MPRHLKQPLTDVNYLDKMIARSREKSESLGDLCRFEVQHLEIEPDKLFDLLEEHGLEDWKPVQIRKKTAARKAITRIRKTLEDPENDLRVIVRPVHTSESDVVRYAIIDETTDTDNLDLDFATRNQVIFRKDTGTIEFTQETVEEILTTFEYLCSVYTEAEINLMVKNIVDKHGCIWIRDGSGMFFMSRTMKGVVNSLVKLFGTLRDSHGAECYFRPMAILDDEENRKHMGEALLSEIENELREANEALDKAAKDDSKRSIAPALVRFNVANNKAKLYKDLLEINVREIDKQTTDAEARAAELIEKMAKE